MVPVPLVGVPEHRERLLLRSLIQNAARFFRYLLAVLAEEPGQIGPREAVEGIDGETGSPDGGGAGGLPLLERLLRTMRQHPDRFAGLHPLVSDLIEGEVLPSDFAELWETIHAVATGGEPDR